jgi:hypothetical protein
MHEFPGALQPAHVFPRLRRLGARQGLDYFADAEPQTMFVSNHGAKVAEPLLKEAGNDQVLMEQYLDFLTNRSFRRSLLIHAGEKKGREVPA